LLRLHQWGADEHPPVPEPSHFAKALTVA
jgi:hypothetical protein